MTMRLKTRVLSLGLLILPGLAGCATLEPAYERPAPPIPAAFPQTSPHSPGQTPGQPSGAASVEWTKFILDPKLRSVVSIALKENRDLRVAVLNIAAARAQYRVQRANLAPQISASGGADYARESAASFGLTTPGEPSAYNLNVYSASVGATNYELDLFGKIRSLTKASFEQYLATEEARRSTQITLISEVATDYLTLAADKAILNAAQETLTSSQASLTLAQRRFDRGVASALDVRQAEGAVDQAQSDVAADKATVDQDRNALALVMGAPLSPDLEPDALDGGVRLMQDLPADLPSDVLLSRPDVLEAEHQLKAANAQIGAARAAFFPSISLTGSGGGVSTDLGTLFKGASGVWSFTPQITVPLFAGGANRANLDLAKTDRAISVAQYEKAIQTAFREVADALARRATIQAQVKAQEAGVEAADDALRLSQARYGRGSDTYLNVLVAQRTLYAAEQTLVAARLIRSQNLIDLYKALGGGAPPPASTR